MSFFNNLSSSTFRSNDIISLVNGFSYSSMFYSVKKMGFEEMKKIIENKNNENENNPNIKYNIPSQATSSWSSPTLRSGDYRKNDINSFLGGAANAKNDFIETNQTEIIINTLPYNEQDCLIPYTLPFTEEEIIINNIIENGLDNKVKIIIYGRNCNDENVEKKSKQLSSFGFQSIYIYTGGLFEWVLLQDIYGVNEFPTTTVVLDILKFSPNKNV